MPKTPAGKVAAQPQDPQQVKVARAIGKALWERDFKKSNPDADAAAKRAAWAAARADYMRAARQMQARLSRAGLTITAPAG